MLKKALLATNEQVTLPFFFIYLSLLVRMNSNFGYTLILNELLWDAVFKSVKFKVFCAYIIFISPKYVRWSCKYFFLNYPLTIAPMTVELLLPRA